MNNANTICHDVDLLGDWLDARGYTEEAGLCLRVLGLIHEQAEKIEKLQTANDEKHEVIQDQFRFIEILKSDKYLLWKRKDELVVENYRLRHLVERIKGTPATVEGETK